MQESQIDTIKDGWRREKEGEIIILNGESGPQFLEM